MKNNQKQNGKQMNENKQKWGDSDWAKYLACPVSRIHQYKKILKQNFLPCIEWDKEYREFYFALYKREILPSGGEKLTTLMTGGTGFDLHNDAIKDAYENIMPGVTLDENWARGYNMPTKAIQMMHVRMR